MDDEFGVDEDSQLDLFGSADGAEDCEPDEQPYPWEDCGDDEEAWLRSLPPDLRAEVEARPALSPARPGASLWDAVGGAAAFADGGFCEAMPPGSALGEMLAMATGNGFPTLSDDVLSGVLRAWQRQVSNCQAELGHVVAEIRRRRIEQSLQPGSSQIAAHVADEVGVELTLTSRSAERLVDVVTGLQRLPDVNSALLSGLIDWPRACVFVAELAVLDDSAAVEISERLADRATRWTTGQLRAALARAVLVADPGAADRRMKQTRKETRVELWHEPSGNAALAGRELRIASAITLDRKLSSDADWLSACGVPGGRDELRALAYTTLLSGRELAAILDDPASWPPDPGQANDGSATLAANAAGDARDGAPAAATARDGAASRSGAADRIGAAGRSGAAGGRGAAGRRGAAGFCGTADAAPAAGSIHLTIPVSAWLGGSEPAEVTGYGPVDASTSRELAGLLSADPATRWCLTLIGADGTAVAHACARHGPAAGEPVISWAAGLSDQLTTLESGTCRHARLSAGYGPPSRLRHLVMVRQQRCAFPGCRRPARQCDLDHTIPYERGGITCECNLAPT